MVRNDVRGERVRKHFVEALYKYKERLVGVQGIWGWEKKLPELRFLSEKDLYGMRDGILRGMKPVASQAG